MQRSEVYTSLYLSIYLSVRLTIYKFIWGSQSRRRNIGRAQVKMDRGSHSACQRGVGGKYTQQNFPFKSIL